MNRAPLRGLVLAGGQSRRMGRDKAALPWAGGTLLTHAVDLLSGVTGDVLVVGGPRRPAGRATFAPDRIAGRGPLGGLYTAMELDPAAAWLTLAVDLPLVSAALLRRLDGARSPGAQAVVAQTDDGLQPLCAIYEPAAGPAVAERWRQDRLAMMELLAGLRVTPVAADAAELRNLNFPRDLRDLGNAADP